jgi:hypothetical protein
LECDDEHLKIAEKDAIIKMKEKMLCLILGDAIQPPSYLNTVKLPPEIDSVEDGDIDSEMEVLEARMICDILWKIFHLQVSICCRSFILNFSEIHSVEDDEKDSGMVVLEARII